MPTLFPPLEPMISADSSDTPTMSSAAPTSNFNADSLVKQDVLSPALVHNFETLKSLLSTPDNTKRDSENGKLNNTHGVKRRKAAEDLAIATALAVEREVTLLQNGISELEAMLATAAQQDNSRQYDAARRDGFPSLPPLIPDDEEYGFPRNCADHASDATE